jgi:hypothetical protein
MRYFSYVLGKMRKTNVFGLDMSERPRSSAAFSNAFTISGFETVTAVLAGERKSSPAPQELI